MVLLPLGCWLLHLPLDCGAEDLCGTRARAGLGLDDLGGSLATVGPDGFASTVESRFFVTQGLRLRTRGPTLELDPIFRSSALLSGVALELGLGRFGLLAGGGGGGMSDTVRNDNDDGLSCLDDSVLPLQ